MRFDISIVIFAMTLFGTLLVSYLGRRHERRVKSAALSNQHLSRWLVGLSAGATANSGFVVTGAVGLGYSFGAQWLMLPLAWLVGDAVFWMIFPDRINRVGAAAQAATLTDVVVNGLPSNQQRSLRRLVAVVILVCLGGYVSAQWLAGEKFLSGAFGFGSVQSLFVFATVIVVYSSLGGFRGSIYADTLQASIRILGTAVAAVAITVAASRDTSAFWSNLSAAGPDFLRLVPGPGLAAVFSIVGFAAAALGFGLGQPQMVTRYLAGASPQETKSAWWIYISFVQITWIAMTAFGIVLRGVMPNLGDPEMGLSVFHRSTTGPVITGIIAADIFATIAATSNSLLVAMAQTLKFDFRGRDSNRVESASDLWLPIGVIGVITMVISANLHSTVVGLALSSVSLMGAGLAPAMMIRVLHWRHSGASLASSVTGGIVVAAFWNYAGLSQTMNEATPGILAGLLLNYLVAKAQRVESITGVQNV